MSARYYKGIFVTFTPPGEVTDHVYYCYQCITVGGELDVASSTVYNADMIVGLMNGSVIIITSEEKITIGREEIADLLNGEASKIYGELPENL
ncbi:hypothetical protein SFV1gp29 [Sulfolobus filamentous virus 1]|uniref:Uncharacterized protein n=2 Tax=Alphalipothrixvirus beppuense TaxID=2734584 RepID=A0A346LU68_SUFV1|nr:hypothetical protein HOT91_gp29 [Sulfolobus filamentous virus 1]AXQ00111.1 hypothetical protein SFV1gp29 [Sulfolobus filamentous virus 1]AZI75731.1 hypothetical protein SBFV1_gp30 [Sulfolobales Beppu filamentous phage 1]